MAEKNVKNRKLKIKKESGSLILDVIYTIIGSTPMIVIGVISFYLLNQDYRLNGNNFWAQSRFFSNTKPHEYFQNLTCLDKSNLNLNEKCSETKFCGRFFTDYLLTKDEARVLLKIAKDGFSYGKNLDASSNSFNYESGILIENEQIINVNENKNQPLYDNLELKVYQNIKNKVMEEIKTKFNVNCDIESSRKGYFIRLSNMSTHIDFKKEPFKSYCYTTLITLNSFVIDVEGSRLVFNNHIGTKLSIQPRPGRIIAFTPNSIENEVLLEPVKSKFSHILIYGFKCKI